MRKRVLIVGSDTKEGIKAYNFFNSYKQKYVISGISSFSQKSSVFYNQIDNKLVKDIFVTNKNEKIELINKYPKKNIYLESEYSLIKFVKHSDSNIVVFAIPGLIAVKPILSAIGEYKDICISNLDPVLYTGDIIINEARNKSVDIYFMSLPIYSMFIFSNNRSLSNLNCIDIVYSKNNDVNKNYLKNFKKENSLSVFKNKAKDLYYINFIQTAYLLKYIFDVNVDRFNFYEQNKHLINLIVCFKDGAKLVNSTSLDVYNVYNYYFLESIDFVDGDNLVDITNIESLNYKIEKINPFKKKILNLALKALKKGGTLPILFYILIEKSLCKIYENKMSFKDLELILEKVILKRSFYISNPDFSSILSLESQIDLFIEENIKSSSKKKVKNTKNTKNVKKSSKSKK